VSNGTSNGHHGANGRLNGVAEKSRLLDDIRHPPQNIEAEMGVIGGILLDNEVVHELAGFLDADDLYRDDHQVIYRAIQELYANGKKIDVITLADELTRREQYKSIGGDDTIARIIESVPHAANALHYGQLVRQKSISRKLIEGANQLLRESYSGTFTAEQLLESAEQFVFAVGQHRQTGQPVHLRDILAGVMDRITARTQTGLVGISTGFRDLDDMVGGFTPGQFTIIAARPSMGKTALGLNIAERAAMQGVPTMFVSLEMSKEEIGERSLVGYSRIDGHKVRTGKGLSLEDLEALGSAREKLQNSPLTIDDAPSTTVAKIAAACRRHKAKHGLGLLVVDYIQLIEPGGDTAQGANRQEQVAAISRRLKALPRELKIPAIVLSQLNREGEKRQDKRPNISEIRESGAIEQDADLILLLHRPEYYNANDQPGTAELDVKKNRNGRTGLVKLTFLKHLARFEDLGYGEPVF